MPEAKKEGQTTASAKPADTNPEPAETAKVQSFLTSKGAKSAEVSKIFEAEHKDRREMADKLREWCKKLPKGKVK